jgi:hypothetical protein
MDRLWRDTGSYFIGGYEMAYQRRNQDHLWPGFACSSGGRTYEDVQGAKGFAGRFPQRYRVDKICCFTYTHAVVFRPSGLVVKGKSSGPGTKKQGTGQVKSGRNGAPAPQSRASLSAVRRCSSLHGVKRQRGVPGSSFRFGDLFCSFTRRILRGSVWAARKNRRRDASG